MYKCVECGYTSSKWYGKCPQCGAWDSFVKVEGGAKGESPLRPLEFYAPEGTEEVKFSSTGFGQVDLVLGGGISPGQVILLGGEPGVGKSTLSLEILVNLALQGHNVVYVSGEESGYQVNLRLKRILLKTGLFESDEKAAKKRANRAGQSGKKTNKKRGESSVGVFDRLKILSHTEIEPIISTLSEHDLNFVVFDSLQAFSAKDGGVVGGVSQAKIVTSLITSYAKNHKVGTILIGQVTKAGAVAGPKTVEHAVDTVLYLEPFGIGNVRVLRSVKNRFGAVGELGFLKLETSGFSDYPEAPLELVKSKETSPGSAYGVTVYGVRPLAVQIQSLVVDSVFSAPRLISEGIPKPKLEVLAAVVSRNLPKVGLLYKDIFVKGFGFLGKGDSGIDLALVASLISARLAKPLPPVAFVGEVGLLGEIRPTYAWELREAEAKKLGFKKVFTHKSLRHIRDILKMVS